MSKIEQKGIMLLFEADKAFNIIEWNFLHHILKWFNLDRHFLGSAELFMNRELVYHQWTERG